MRKKIDTAYFVKVFQVSVDEGMGEQRKLVGFSTQKRFSNSCLRD